MLFFYDFSLFLYRTGIHIAALWNTKAKLWVRGRQDFPVFSSHTRKIWMHCASLGEFEQGRPVLQALKQQYPDHEIILSFYSPSGYEVRKNEPLAHQVIYLPADTRKNAERLIREMRPELVVWVKYEYWYHYLHTLKKNNIPVALIAAIFRPSQPFFGKTGNFWKRILRCFSLIAVQDETSVNLLHNIQISENVMVCGDTRFDRVVELLHNAKEIPVAAEFSKNHFTVVAGSTWTEDENTLAVFAAKHPKLKLIIAPHEINQTHLQQLKKIFPDSLLFSKTSQHELELAKVLIIDNIGMLSSLYRYGNLCYVGGGFNTSGIHNILEAAVYGKAIVIGPNYEKFAEARALISSGGLLSGKDTAAVVGCLQTFLKDEESRKKAETNNAAYTKEQAGATKKIMDQLERNLLLTR
jgi:3-deoxy-D-manno-octulosonic-acid transferase